MGFLECWWPLAHVGRLRKLGSWKFNSMEGVVLTNKRQIQDLRSQPPAEDADCFRECLPSLLFLLENILRFMKVCLLVNLRPNQDVSEG